MKKLLAYICIMCMLMTATPSFSLSQIESISSEKDIKTVKVDGATVQFETQPIVLNKTIMVPMKEFFQALGCDVKWINDTKEVIAYKNNMFIKLKINNLTAYKNGKAQKLDEAPIIRNGKTLVPANFIAETFDMNVNYDPIKQLVEITSTTETNKYTILSNSFFKEQPINEYGVSISTPTFWNKVSGLNNTFTYSDDFEYYKLVVNKQDLDTGVSLNRFTELHKAKLLEVYGEALSFNGKSTLRTENFNMNVVYLSTTIDGEARNQILYFVTANGVGYIITCTYGRYVNEEDAVDLFNNIMSTFQVNNLTLNAEEEHYFEFNRYFEKRVKLDTEIYSNMSVDNAFVIKGTLKAGHNISELKAIVSKDKEKLEFPIAIEGNTFSGTIYLPFGLGKHNVILAGIEHNATVEPVGEPITVYVNDSIVIPDDEAVTETKTSATEKELTTEQELEEIKALTEKLSQQNSGSGSTASNTANLKDTEKEIAMEVDLSENKSSDTTLSTSTVQEKHYDNLEDYYLMKFSVVNLNNEKIRYSIPSRLINSDSMELYNMANYITYKSTSDYAKSRTLFQWINENITIVSSADQSLHARTSLEILNSKTATQEEIPILYCALLRSLNIPSRVMAGHFDGEVSYWTEILLNGTWIVSNPSWEILYRDDLTKNNVYTNYFNVYRPSHYSAFEHVDLLPY
ncbi:MAG: hypothetical protein JXO44_05395 [Clostridia bacterium]|nr:hypothetical protein [Clostridia bacterium]